MKEVSQKGKSPEKFGLISGIRRKSKSLQLARRKTNEDSVKLGAIPAKIAF